MTDTSAPRPRLSFFFPAHNEAENVERAVESALGQIGPLVPSLEVVIVDDGSTDATPEIADRIAAADPRVRVVHQPNRGYGGALKTGFRESRGELIAFSDGDLQFDLSEMRLLLERLESETPAPVDAVIGYRLRRRDPAHRRFIGRTYNTLVTALFGLRARDIDCAMKLFRRECFEGLNLESDGPFLSAELLIKLKARGVRMAQLGVHHYPREAGTNTGASPVKILRTLRDLGRLRLAMWRGNGRVGAS